MRLINNMDSEVYAKIQKGHRTLKYVLIKGRDEFLFVLPVGAEKYKTSFYNVGTSFTKSLYGVKCNDVVILDPIGLRGNFRLNHLRENKVEETKSKCFIPADSNLLSKLKARFNQLIFKAGF